MAANQISSRSIMKFARKSVKALLLSLKIVTWNEGWWVGWFVGCLTSQQHASVSKGWICSDNCMCCPTEREAADQTVHLTQSQYTDTWPTSPSTDPVTLALSRVAQVVIEPCICRSLTTRSMRPTRMKVKVIPTGIKQYI